MVEKQILINLDSPYIYSCRLKSESANQTLYVINVIENYKDQEMLLDEGIFASFEIFNEFFGRHDIHYCQSNDLG